MKNGLNVYVPTQYIPNRGQTLGGPCLDITITSTQRNVIKVALVHCKGGLDNIPQFELNEDQGFSSEISKRTTAGSSFPDIPKLLLPKFRTVYNTIIRARD